ncbi:hypothetical protein [Thauera propionica]|jgi:hypothetical protein|nr:hypothetical protein [Thauera propionica]MDD3677160.1 hypothetical protein [Thauera propionica]
MTELRLSAIALPGLSPDSLGNYLAPSVFCAYSNRTTRAPCASRGSRNR